jgi:hypothetical protein
MVMAAAPLRLGFSRGVRGNLEEIFDAGGHRGGVATGDPLEEV